MRASALKNISEDHVLECTPLKASAGKIKRARSQSSAIPCFEPLQEDQEMASPCPSNTRAAQAAANISPFARSQPECHLLPCTSSPTDPIMRVEASTVSDLLAGRYNDLYDEQIVVDCRFPYEYEGGHIASAANAPTIEALEQMLLDKPASNKRTVVILHCEYSIQRAPSMASHLRRRDREVNMHRYPYLHYPEIYVLKGGYRNFFSQHKSLCEPQNYVEMNDQAFTVDCRERMLQFNRQFKRTKSMNDAALTRSSAGYASATVGAPGALFAANSQSPTNMLGRTASSLPARARRLGRTQSARPGIDLVNFTNNS
ncbi:m-phase inducer phosphatase [Dipsacomyces acuminosporus]|nr:m-phase inducer phosphatase [Dipsacomyces acuminosporus]